MSNPNVIRDAEYESPELSYAEVVRAAGRKAAAGTMIEIPLNTALWPGDEMPKDEERLLIDGLRRRIQQ